MERIFKLHIELLPEGVYLGTSDEVQGLVVQGDTVAQVIEYAQDAARMLREIQVERGLTVPEGKPMPESWDFPLVLAA